MANYLYNGVELPPLPDWDKTAYPYATITRTLTGVNYWLSLTSKPQVLSESYALTCNEIYNVDYYIYAPDEGLTNFTHINEAVSGATFPTLSVGAGSLLLVSNSSLDTTWAWSNHDILMADGSVYLAASDPVPVDGETEAAPITPYLRKNGAWQKQDTYKRVGGQWVKQTQDGYEMVETVWQPIFEKVEEPTPEPEPEPLPAVGTSLEDCTWEQISAISAAGKAAEYFSVGDTKSVYLKGTVGTLALDTTLYVYILGFDHNSEVEGAGITFGTFKTSDGKDVCLVDSKNDSSFINGTKYFNMNHWGAYNYGGWAGCDMRYDILGSTDNAPSGYGAAKTTSVVGYDPSSACATSPVANTLMAALPSDLRAVMKPMTKYSNNTGNSGDTEAKVTVTTDYLPLLAEFEIFGARGYANSYEQNYQKQYDYFVAGNSKKKYCHSAISTTTMWWGRSAYYGDGINFCHTHTVGVNSYGGSNSSYGLAPIFLV